MPDIHIPSKNIQRWLARPDRPAIAPLELAGKWVAWNSTRTEIVGHADTMKEADELGRASGMKYVLQKVPSPKVLIPTVRIAPLK
jgi:hypothetical protein